VGSGGFFAALARSGAAKNPSLQSKRGTRAALRLADRTNAARRGRTEGRTGKMPSDLTFARPLAEPGEQGKDELILLAVTEPAPKLGFPYLFASDPVRPRGVAGRASSVRAKP